MQQPTLTQLYIMANRHAEDGDIEQARVVWFNILRIIVMSSDSLFLRIAWLWALIVNMEAHYQHELLQHLWNILVSWLSLGTTLPNSKNRAQKMIIWFFLQAIVKEKNKHATQLLKLLPGHRAEQLLLELSLTETHRKIQKNWRWN
jgi:hypothetical protein